MDTPSPESRKMSVFKDLRRGLVCLLALALLSIPQVLPAQTAESRAREEARLRELEHRLQELHQEQAALQHEHQARLQAQLAELEQHFQERARDQQLRQREAQEHYQEALKRIQERVQERVRLARVREDDVRRRLQEVVVRVRSRVRLGVQLVMPQEEYADQGALLAGVVDDSPAQEAGLQKGDIITHLNGHSLLEPIPDEDEEDFELDESLPVQRLMALASELEEGEEVTVRYLRDGEAATVTFEAAEVEGSYITVQPGNFEGRRGVVMVRPDTHKWSFVAPDSENFHFEIPEFETQEWKQHMEDELANLYIRGETWSGEAPNVYTVFRSGRRYGLELTELNEGLARYFSTDQGVLVLNVDEESELGLTAGDVILRIGDREVEDRGDVSRILSSYEDDETVTFTVMRDGRETAVEGRIG
jgi:C-terminal processing protease CtpA/Prc